MNPQKELTLYLDFNFLWNKIKEKYYKIKSDEVSYQWEPYHSLFFQAKEKSSGLFVRNLDQYKRLPMGWYLADCICDNVWHTLEKVWMKF